MSPRLLPLLALVLGLSPLARADLSPRERALVVAEIEGQRERLAHQPDLLPSALSVTVEDTEDRTLAGSTLRRRKLTIEAPAEAAIAWLRDAHRARLVCRSPLKLSRTGSPSRAIALTLTAWLLPTRDFDPGAPGEELRGLCDNLRWLERQREAMPALIDFLEIAVLTEGVRPERLSADPDKLRLEALALDERARDAYSAAIREAAADLALPLDLSVSTPPPGEPSAEPFQLRGLPGAFALMLVAALGNEEAVLLPEAGDLPPVSGASAPGALVDWILRKLGRGIRRCGPIAVVGPLERGCPEVPPPLPPRGLELAVLEEPFTEVWRRWSIESGVPILVPASAARLTGALHRRPSGEVAAIVAFAQGLRLSGDAALLVGLPEGAPEVPDQPAGRVSLWAQSAPVSALAGGLLAAPGLESCAGREVALDLEVRAVPAGRLLAGLLGAASLTLAGERLVGEAGAGQGCRPVLEKPGEGPVQLRAVLETAGQQRALLQIGSAFAWRSLGERLPDGRALERIKPRRVDLSDPPGSTEAARAVRAETLRAEVPQAEAPRPAPPADLRALWLDELSLSATAVLPGKPPLAVVLDPSGAAHRVGVGTLLGRRCGRIAAIQPGQVAVQIDCGRETDPRGLVLRLR